MAKDIKLMGATYRSVPAVELPTPTSGVSAKFYELSDDTVTSASHIVKGYSGHLANGDKVEGTAVRIIKGEFIGHSSNSVLTINLPYDGNGYPVSCKVYPTEGPYNSGGSFYKLQKRYAINTWDGVKINLATVPTYNSSNAENAFSCVVSYKSSSNNSYTYSGSWSASANILRASAPASNRFTALRFYSKNQMRAYIMSGSYGFAQSIPYTYEIAFSE